MRLVWPDRFFWTYMRTSFIQSSLKSSTTGAESTCCKVSPRRNPSSADKPRCSWMSIKPPISSMLFCRYDRNCQRLVSLAVSGQFSRSGSNSEVSLIFPIGLLLSTRIISFHQATYYLYKNMDLQSYRSILYTMTPFTVGTSALVLYLNCYGRGTSFEDTTVFQHLTHAGHQYNCVYPAYGVTGVSRIDTSGGAWV